MFVGFTALSANLQTCVITRDGSNIPKDADAAPTYRVYGPAGVLLQGSLTAQDSKALTAASNASPIAVTSTGHGLQTGMRVTISGVTGNTAANGTFNVTVTNSNTFTLDGSTGNGGYLSGGTWHVAGLYNLSVTPTGAAAFAVGIEYTVVVNYLMSASARAQVFSFGVV